jgi:uncharacterized protein with HEPN domain
MPKRDADLLIEDIQTALTRIESYTTGLDRETFLQDQKTIDAVVRNLEIIGESRSMAPDRVQRSARLGAVVADCWNAEPDRP